MDIKMININDVIPYEKNAKKHPEEQVEYIANSIKRFGWKQPIVIDKENVVVVGHGRLLAAQKLGYEQVPVLYADDLTEDEIKAFRLADNKTNESDWDFELLDLELEELEPIEDIDMGDFGFGEPEGGGGEQGATDTESSSGFNYQEQYGVIVMCEDEPEQETVYNRLTGEGYTCKVVAV